MLPYAESGQANELHEKYSLNSGPWKGLLKSSRFMPAVEQVGYQAQMDQSVLKVMLKLVKESIPTYTLFD